MRVKATENERDRVCGTCIARTRLGCNLDSWDRCKKGHYEKRDKCVLKGEYL